MAEQIEVTWIATAQAMMTTIDKMNKKWEDQERALKKVADAGTTAGTEVAGSFNKLEKELKEAETALRKLSVGTKMFDDQKTKVEGLRAEMGRLKQSLQSNSTQVVAVGANFGNMSEKATLAAGAVKSVISALIAMSEARNKVVKEGADIAVSLDTMARNFQVQAGMTDPERQAFTAQTLETARVAGVKPEDAFAAATQLQGSDFQDIARTLESILKLQQATNFTGDPKELVQGISQTLNAFQMPRNQANTESLGIAAQGLFKGTDLELVDLGDFAKNASVFKDAGLTLTESLAGFTALREILPGAEAGTGARNFVQILRTAAGNKEQTQALHSMGLAPEQVDFVGENFKDVIETLLKAAEKMTPVARQLAMGDLFGRENVAAATAFFPRAGRVAELEAMQGNRQQFEADAAVKRGSAQAERNRIDTERLQRTMPRADEFVAADAVIQRKEDDLAARQREQAMEPGVAGHLGTLTGGATAVRAAVFVEELLPERGMARDFVDKMVPGVQLSLPAEFFRWIGLLAEKQDDTLKAIERGNEVAERGPPPEPQRPKAEKRPAAIQAP